MHKIFWPPAKTCVSEVGDLNSLGECDLKETSRRMPRERHVAWAGASSKKGLGEGHLRVRLNVGLTDHASGPLRGPWVARTFHHATHVIDVCAVVLVQVALLEGVVVSDHQ